jgi:steroid Delta-isomerase
MDLIEEHVVRFNAGVRSGDFGPMLEQFAENAELAFRGVPAGPFVGRAAIADAYRERPPDDELDLLDVRKVPGAIRAGYAWRARPDHRAGEMRFELRDGRIARLLVTFEG